MQWKVLSTRLEYLEDLALFEWKQLHYGNHIFRWNHLHKDPIQELTFTEAEIDRFNLVQFCRSEQLLSPWYSLW